MYNVYSRKFNTVMEPSIMDTFGTSKLVFLMEVSFIEARQTWVKYFTKVFNYKYKYLKEEELQLQIQILLT